MDKHRLPDGRTKLLAHDVRHLTTCSACGELGDDRTMIRCDKIGMCVTYHDECVVNAFTHKEILRLPFEELEKFTIKAAGVDLMKAIMKQYRDVFGD